MGNVNQKFRIMSYSWTYAPHDNFAMVPIGFIKYLIDSDIYRTETLELNSGLLTLNQLDSTQYFNTDQVYNRIKTELGFDLSVYSFKSLDLVRIDRDRMITIKQYFECTGCNNKVVLDDGCRKCYNGCCNECTGLKDVVCPYCQKNTYETLNVHIPDTHELLSKIIRIDQESEFAWVGSWLLDTRIIPKNVIRLEMNDDVMETLCPHIYAVICKERDGCVIYDEEDDVSPLMTIIRAGNSLYAKDHDFINLVMNELDDF